MRPNTMGIGRFLLEHRHIQLLRLLEIVLITVYAYFPTPNLDIGHALTEVAFVHTCDSCTAYPGYYINENGYCTQCGKFIASHKKLEVMVGLKELKK